MYVFSLEYPQEALVLPFYYHPLKYSIILFVPHINYLSERLLLRTSSDKCCLLWEMLLDGLESPVAAKTLKINFNSCVCGVCVCACVCEGVCVCEVCACVCV